MEKQTLKFIYGLFLVLAGALSAGIAIMKLTNGQSIGWFDSFFMAMGILAAISGATKIHDVID